MAPTPPYDHPGLRRNGSAVLGAPLRAGWFRFHFADEHWEWSDEVALIHGYEPGAVTPTTALIMSHKHPDDRAMMSAHLDYVRRTHEPVSSRHRIINVQGETRDVVVAGQEVVGTDGAVVGTTGFYIDVTPTLNTVRESAKQQAISEVVATVVDGRALIEQVKGMLVLIYGIDAEAAFGLLRWRSQTTNVKLRLLAERLIEEFRALSRNERLPERSAFDNVLLTAHERAGENVA